MVLCASSAVTNVRSIFVFTLEEVHASVRTSAEASFGVWRTFERKTVKSGEVGECYLFGEPHERNNKY